MQDEPAGFVVYLGRQLRRGEIDMRQTPDQVDAVGRLPGGLCLEQSGDVGRLERAVVPVDGGFHQDGMEMLGVEHRIDGFACLGVCYGNPVA